MVHAKQIGRPVGRSYDPGASIYDDKQWRASCKIADISQFIVSYSISHHTESLPQWFCELCRRAGFAVSQLRHHLSPFLIPKCHLTDTQCQSPIYLSRLSESSKLYIIDWFHSWDECQRAFTHWYKTSAFLLTCLILVGFHRHFLKQFQVGNLASNLFNK